MPVAIITLNSAVRDFSRMETKNTKMAERIEFPVAV